MDLLRTALAFLFAICFLVVFHELGHYWVARLCNVKVLRFSLGMGKVLFSRRFGPDQTEWVISALPLGGYVKMLDLREQGLSSLAAGDEGREFTRQPVSKRIAIVAAGPIANFILAIVLFSGMFMVGVPEPVAKLQKPVENTQAYQLGVRGDELVTAVNGKPIRRWSELRWELMQLVLEKSTAVLTMTSHGSSRDVTFSLNALSERDLDADFMGKLGLGLSRPPALLGKVMPEGAAYRAGLREGDVITEVDGKSDINSINFISLVQAAPSRVLHLRGNRGGHPSEWQVTPEPVQEKGRLIGRISVEIHAMPEMVTYRETLAGSVKKAVEHTWSTSVITVKMMAKMLIGQVSLKNITGPLTLADYAGQTAKIGWVSYLNFLAFISISLGVMNLLPIPVLDGGHLLYYSLEVLTGRPVSERFGQIAQRAGFAILLLLMAVAFFNDIARLMPS